VPVVPGYHGEQQDDDRCGVLLLLLLSLVRPTFSEAGRYACSHQPNTQQRNNDPYAVLACVSPCTDECHNKHNRLFAEADGVGFPMLVKAVSGGGGKGMKLAATKVGVCEGTASVPVLWRHPSTPPT
jgi:hypothetical protein